MFSWTSKLTVWVESAFNTMDEWGDPLRCGETSRTDTRSGSLLPFVRRMGIPVPVLDVSVMGWVVSGRTAPKTDPISSRADPMNEKPVV